MFVSPLKMFVLPVIIFPLVFGLAIFRLYQIPKKLLSGELRLPARYCTILFIATVCAYFVLLIYTVLLITSLVLALFFAENLASAYFSLIIYVAAYPFVYIGVAWIFYYGFSRRV